MHYGKNSELLLERSRTQLTLGMRWSTVFRGACARARGKLKIPAWPGNANPSGCTILVQKWCLKSCLRLAQKRHKISAAVLVLLVSC